MSLTLTPLPGIPMVRPGDDLAALLIAAFARAELTPENGDVLAVAQKIVSKAEGRLIDLDTIAPSARAIGATVLTSNARDFAAIREVRSFELTVVPA